MAVVESVKAASDVYSPISGLVLEINVDLADEPEKINIDPYGGGWIVRLQSPSNIDSSDIMNPDSYQAMLDELEA